MPKCDNFRIWSLAILSVLFLAFRSAPKIADPFTLNWLQMPKIVLPASHLYILLSMAEYRSWSRGSITVAWPPGAPATLKIRNYSRILCLVKNRMRIIRYLYSPGAPHALLAGSVVAPPVAACDAPARTAAIYAERNVQFLTC